MSYLLALSCKLLLSHIVSIMWDRKHVCVDHLVPDVSRCEYLLNPEDGSSACKYHCIPKVKTSGTRRPWILSSTTNSSAVLSVQQLQAPPIKVAISGIYFSDLGATPFLIRIGNTQRNTDHIRNAQKILVATLHLLFILAVFPGMR